ncbi:MAG: hypothetical protein GY930_20970 [bacterium]|nr:hypothetical protein [bacterium]
MQRFVGLCLCLLVLFQGSSFAQSKRKHEITPARLEKLIRAATQGSPVVRPQAAQRLVKMGEVGHKAVFDFVSSKPDLFDVGPELLEAAAQLAVPLDGKRAELRKRFWKDLGNLDFPWRASLVSGLGKNMQAGETEAFVALLEDRMLAVRLAALKGFADVDAKLILPRIQARLKVETEGGARRALARRAYEAGQASSLWILYGELGRDDRFFDQPVGLIARLEASRFLKALLPEGPAFDAQAAVDSEAALAGRAAWLAYLKPIAGPQLTEPVPTVIPRGTAILGLELRSCRRGEFFLRWTDGDQLWLGRGNPVCFDLQPGSHKALIAQAQGTLAALGGKHLTGQPGCDQESYHFQLPGSKRPSVYLITKGPRPVPELRPLPLNGLLADLVASLSKSKLPESISSELVEALKDLGGSY